MFSKRKMKELVQKNLLIEQSKNSSLGSCENLSAIFDNVQKLIISINESMERPHSLLHHHIIDAVNCLKTGLCTESTKIINDFKAAEAASSELFVLLDRLPSER